MTAGPRVAAVLLVSALALGCSSVEVKPWQRGKLAEPAMQLDDTGTAERLPRQYYYSREAARGGAGFSGTGCGCN